MFEEMKAWLQTDDVENYQFGYDDPYADYVGGIYYNATAEVSQEVNDDIFIEPSIQAGMGGVFMTCNNGTNHWDFEGECELLLELASESETEEEFKNGIKAFILNKYEECEEEDDEDEEDDDYEGCEEDEEDDD